MVSYIDVYVMFDGLKLLNFNYTLIGKTQHWLQGSGKTVGSFECWVKFKKYLCSPPPEQSVGVL